MKTSSYILVEGKKLHFYKLGKGPALVLFHPSPHTSEILLPLAEKLSGAYTVFAVDTPGYGKSEALETTPKDLKDYTLFLHKCFNQMNLKSPSIYGSATGAQLAIRYALEYPDAVGNLFLDNAAHFEDAFRNQILEQYFPDLTPQIDGSHLPKVWQMVSQMFQYFPWCFTKETYALNRPQLPAIVLNSIALDFLRAGTNYHLAYRLAFMHENAKYVQALSAPTTIIRWNGSIIKEHIDNLLAFNFPENIKTLSIVGSQEERLGLIANYINKSMVPSNDYRLSESIKVYQNDKEIAYNKITQDLPKINLEGSHLYKAWEILVKLNPDVGADVIQSYLVDTYTKI